MKVALLLIVLATLGASTPIPSISLHQSSPTYSYAAYPNDSCAKIMLTPNYFFRLGSNNVISAVNKTSLATAGTLLNYTYTLVLGLLIKPNAIQDFDVDHNQTLITLAQPSSTNILSLMDFKMNKSTTTAPFSKVRFTDYVLTGVMRNSNGQPDVFYQGQISAAILQSALSIVLTPNSLSSVKNCDSVHSPNHNFQLYWDQYSNVFVFNVTNTTVAPVLLGKVSSNCSAANRTQTIAFSKDSNYFIIEADDQIPLKIVSLLPQSLLSFRSFTFGGSITKAMYLDAQSTVIAIFNDTAATFIEAATFTVLNRQSFPFHSYQIEVDYSTGMIYVCKDSAVDVYNSSVTVVGCPDHCQTCLEPTTCKVCAANYILENEECEFDPAAASSSLPNGTASPNNNTHPIDNTASNIPNNSTSTNSTVPVGPSSNLTSNSTANQTDLNYLILVMPDGSVRIFEMSALQSLVLNTTVETLGVSNSILEHVMVCMASTPLIYLALSNLQFFTVSSLYALLHMPLPATIFNVLEHTAAAINSNMFTAFGVNPVVPPMGEERVGSERSIQMGVSSQFVQCNYQFFLLSLLSLLVLYGMKGLLHCCQKSRFLYGLLNHSTSDVSFGLIVSTMIPFLLPYLAVFLNSYSASFLDKLNQSMQFVAIGFALLVGGLYVALVGIEPKSKKPRKKGRLGGYFPSLMKEVDNLHLIALNLFCPLLVVIGEPLYFLLLSPVLMGFGVWTATLPCKWRANKVILSVHPILFHLCFIVFQFSSHPDVLIYAEIACLIIYFLGSAHELLTMLFSLVYYIYRLTGMKKPTNRVEPLTDKLEEKAVRWHLKFEKSTAVSTSVRSKLPVGDNLARLTSSSSNKARVLGVNEGLGPDSKVKMWSLRKNLMSSRFVRKGNSPKPSNVLNVLSMRQGKHFNHNN